MDPRRLLPVLAALASACVAATLVVSLGRAGGGTSSDSSPEPDAAHSAAAVPGGPAAVLARWDEQRAEAWAEGDEEALAALYVDGSRTGAADVRLLGDYRERGLTVEGLATQLLALEVVERTADRLVVVVTDRVSGGRAVGGGTDVVLPSDRASTRRVVLVRARDGGAAWLVSEATDRGGPQDRAAARTSRTSSSSKS